MRLRAFTTARDVPRFSQAISPGKHCPLFGAGNILRGISGITFLYLGTQDCVYYAQKSAMERSLSSHAPQGQSRILAVQLSDADLIFGIRPQLEQLLEEEACRTDTKAVFLVTSCSIEVLSEDIQGVVDLVAGRTGKKICLIQTDHFKSFSYFDGMEAALSALVEGLQPKPKTEKTFAVLGPRYIGGETSEPVQFLLSQGYRMECVLPYQATLEQIEQLPGVSLTLVLDGTGLSVARTLSDSFGVPYVCFDRKLSLASITQAWEQLMDLTALPIRSWIDQQLEEIEVLTRRVSAAVTGKTFFYSQVMLYPFETCLFLTSLGMIPTYIFLGSILDHSDEPRLALARLVNPELLQNASSEAAEALAAEKTPDYFIGASARLPEQLHIRHVNFRMIPVDGGFRFYKQCLNQLLCAAEGELEHESI